MDVKYFMISYENVPLVLHNNPVTMINIAKPVNYRWSLNQDGFVGCQGVSSKDNPLYPPVWPGGGF